MVAERQQAAGEVVCGQEERILQRVRHPIGREALRCQTAVVQLGDDHRQLQAIHQPVRYGWEQEDHPRPGQCPLAQESETACRERTRVPGHP